MPRMKYIAVVKVKPIGPMRMFPIDMLRYDRMTPFTESDSAEITANIMGRDGGNIPYVMPSYGYIFLQKLVERKEPSGVITPLRWQSFGWEAAIHEWRSL